MDAGGRYDPALHMYCEKPREPDLNRLTFLRWLVENDRLEHPVAGPASGDLAVLKARAELGEPPQPQGATRTVGRSRADPVAPG